MSDDLLTKIKTLPDSPGVYLMKDIRGKIICVGKARVLKNLGSDSKCLTTCSRN